MVCQAFLRVIIRCDLWVTLGEKGFSLLPDDQIVRKVKNNILAVQFDADMQNHDLEEFLAIESDVDLLGF